MKMFEQVQFDSNPTVLAAWPGMGNVGLIAVDYLRRKLDSKIFAEIDMSPFFIPDSILVKEGIAQLPEIPTSIFYYSKDPDLIIFESNSQVSGREGILIIKTILDIIVQFQIEHIFTFAAFAHPMSHRNDSEVLVTCNTEKLLMSLKEKGVVPMPDGYIAGLNGLLLGVAASRNINAACLLGTIPGYTINLSYPKASLQIVKFISEILEFQIDITELDQGVSDMDQQFEAIEERIREFVPSVNRGLDQEMSEIEDEKVPHYIMNKIERLFDEARKDRSKAAFLKEELDRWNLFELYENRFLDLFKDK
ncbi:MAG TPA: PAC2 family protein [Chitinispirillaceae bacterium]|nr:PAC2 family protein [Chitinispirillaceae bacterium]